VDPRVDLDDMEKSKFLILPGLELRPVGRPARIQSLYRLHYPGSSVKKELLNVIRSREAQSGGNVLDFYMGGAWFESQPVHRLYPLKCAEH
jgi:hypothetical protein